MYTCIVFISSIVLLTIFSRVTGEKCFDMESAAEQDLAKKVEGCGFKEGDDDDKWYEAFKCVLKRDGVVEGNDIVVAKFKDWESPFIVNEGKKPELQKAMDKCGGGAAKVDFDKYLECYAEEEGKACPDDTKR